MLKLNEAIEHLNDILQSDKKWDCEECRNEHIQLRNWLNELKIYKDLEKQGKLQKLPCTVGDTVWDNDFGQPCSYTVTGFSSGKMNDDEDDDEENDIEGLQIYYRNWNGSIRCSCAASEIGKTVFLSISEAEEAKQ